MGGCWAWRGRIGKVENDKGQRVNEVGPLPDLVEWCSKRTVYILLDANRDRNPMVSAAERDLAKVLGKKGADVRLLRLPASDGKINGPDDFIGGLGDDAFAELFNSATVAGKDGNSSRSVLVMR